MKMRQYKRRYSGRFWFLGGKWAEANIPIRCLRRPFDCCNPRALGV